MSAALFDTFKSELAAVRSNLDRVELRTLRDEGLLERIRNLLRTWVTSVRPAIEPLLNGKRDFRKLDDELERIAALTTKFKATSDYKQRLSNATRLANSLVLFLPPTNADTGPRHGGQDALFISAIPDLPLALVPNPLLGWRKEIEAFVAAHPFDQSVFIMIKYRDRNSRLIKEIKDALDKRAFNGILASDHRVTDDLYNPIACLLCCARGVAVFDAPETGQEFNPNVAYELGMMHLLGRECRILKHDSLKVLHTDILMKLYQAYKSISDAREIIDSWVVAPIQ